MAAAKIIWAYTGNKRPPFAETPATGQESVWDYPRPPKLIADHRRVVVQSGDLLIADSRENYRILETAGPPTFYIPPQNVRLELLKTLSATSVCEWKGAAAVLDNPNRHIGAGGNCLELSKSASPIRHYLRVLLVLSRSNRMLRRWRARAPAARLFLWRLDNQ